VVGLGGCAGVLPDPPEQLTLHVGQSLDVALVPDFEAHGSGSSDDTVLRLLVGSRDDATVTYRAEATGHAVLTTTGAFCMNRTTNEETSGVCPLLAVIVVQ